MAVREGITWRAHEEGRLIQHLIHAMDDLDFRWTAGADETAHHRCSRCTALPQFTERVPPSAHSLKQNQRPLRRRWYPAVFHRLLTLAVLPAAGLPLARRTLPFSPSFLHTTCVVKDFAYCDYYCFVAMQCGLGQHWIRSLRFYCDSLLRSQKEPALANWECSEQNTKISIAKKTEYKSLCTKHEARLQQCDMNKGLRCKSWNVTNHELAVYCMSIQSNGRSFSDGCSRRIFEYERDAYRIEVLAFILHQTLTWEIKKH